MKNINSLQTDSPETITISKVEYEKLQAQSKRVSELESHVEMLASADKGTRGFSRGKTAAGVVILVGGR